MKKLLFCAGVLALAVSSCTEDLDSLSVQQEQAKGITFVAGDENAAVTKGFYDEVVNGEKIEYEPFWWAEQDRIGIISKNTKKGYSAFSTTISGWETADLTTNTAVYKATQSQRSGVFTSVDDNNMLDFNDASTQPAEFLAIYPYSVNSGSNYTVSSTTAGTIEVGDLKSLATQNQNDVKGNGIYENMLKWSYTTATPDAEKPYEAVGEKIELNFQRVLSGLVFKTANATKYTKPATAGGTSIFGNLLSVTAELLGAKQTDGTYDKSETPALIYNSTDAALTLTMPTTAGGEVTAVWNDGNTAKIPTNANQAIDNAYLSSTVQMNSTNGLQWDDDARAYMIVLPLQLQDIDQQTIQITYSFKNIDFVVTKEMGQKNWARGSFYRGHTLDINSYDYLLTKQSGTNTNDRTLIVNKGNFSDVFNANGNIIWPIGTTGSGVSKDEVGTIIVAADVVVTEDDVKGLNEFDNLTSVEMPQVTKIPAGTFTQTQAETKLKTIEMSAVTEIDPAFAAGNMKILENLNLAAYAFENETVNGKLFNNDNKDNLKTLNISGVASMTPMFGVERTLSFQGYTALTTVTVQDGVRLCANAFNGCELLATVEGVVNMLNGTSAFQGCEALTTIKIDGTVIPANAFNGCTQLVNVLKDGAQVQPTRIGEGAFKEVAKSLSSGYFYMDLRNATEIGTNAFLNSKLRSGKSGSDILTVGVETVESGVFAGTNVRMVQFLNATGIKNKAFNNAKDMIQVKFLKPFAYAGGTAEAPGETIFSGDENNENLILFVCDEQTGWSGTTLTLTNGVNSQNYTFKSITIENEPYAE